MSRSWAKGSSTRWRKIRAAVLARDGHRCQIKLRRVCTGQATCVHHVLGRAITGDDPRYLVASCAPCNGAVGQPGRNSPPPRKVSQW